jgi:hypothetical protein
MSTLKVTNIQATGETASRAVSGVAAAWCNLNFSTASIADSNNISSITDNATGRFTASFTNSMANSVYVSSGSGRFNLTDADVSNRGVNHQPASGSVSIVSFICSTGALNDDQGVDSKFHGDLA